jgi:hypothetical protein
MSSSLQCTLGQFSSPCGHFSATSNIKKSYFWWEFQKTKNMGIFYEFFWQNEEKNIWKIPQKNLSPFLKKNLKFLKQIFKTNFYFSYFRCGNFEPFCGNFEAHLEEL